MKGSKTPAEIQANRLLDAVHGGEVEGVHREMDHLWSEVESLKRQMGHLRERHSHSGPGTESSREMLESLLRMAVFARDLAEWERTRSEVVRWSEVVHRKPRSERPRRRYVHDEPDDQQLQVNLSGDPLDRASRYGGGESISAKDYLPATFVRFHSLAIAVIAVATTLLALPVLFGVETVHPAVSGLALAGGISWFLTALADIREWSNRQSAGDG